MVGSVTVVKGIIGREKRRVFEGPRNEVIGLIPSLLDTVTYSRLSVGRWVGQLRDGWVG